MGEAVCRGAVQFGGERCAGCAAQRIASNIFRTGILGARRLRLSAAAGAVGEVLWSFDEEWCVRARNFKRELFDDLGGAGARRCSDYGAADMRSDGGDCAISWRGD